MDRQLADHLEKQAELSKTPFIQNDITERILEKTGGEGLYHKFEVDLSVAHTDEEFIFSGDRLTVENVDDAVTIKLNSRKNSSIDLQSIFGIHAPIKKFYITNAAGSGTLKLLAGSKGMFETWSLRRPVDVRNAGYSVEVIDLSDDTTVTTPNGTNTQTLQPPDGFIYEIINLYYDAPEPVGDTSGTHDLRCFDGCSSSYYIFKNESTHSAHCQIYACELRGSGTNIPTISRELFISGRLKASYSEPLTFKYKNGTDADQTGTRTLKIKVKKIREGA